MDKSEEIILEESSNEKEMPETKNYKKIKYNKILYYFPFNIQLL